MSSNQGSNAAARTTTSRDTTLESLAEESSKIIDDASELGRRAMSTAGHAVKGLRDEGQAALESGRKKALRYKDRFDGLVSENPAKSVLIALGVGALLGFTFGRVRR
jgi:ElaB/YqjD/DUF883 family membrane-anchored ribosome-binding protein